MESIRRRLSIGRPLWSCLAGESGQGVAEYVIILAVIVVAAIILAVAFLVVFNVVFLRPGAAFTARVPNGFLTPSSTLRTLCCC